ncbi:hypothetical protein SynSYN20_00709 [Synechococcus sp. SYN20]|nr:hypothetical protein SynSYN20_00709 [Synechococcus sp. SYN20]
MYLRQFCSKYFWSYRQHYDIFAVNRFALICFMQINLYVFTASMRLALL